MTTNAKTLMSMTLNGLIVNTNSTAAPNIPMAQVWLQDLAQTTG